MRKNTASVRPPILYRIRDWPDPEAPYSPVMTVLVAAVFVLAAMSFG